MQFVHNSGLTETVRGWRKCNKIADMYKVCKISVLCGAGLLEKLFML